MPALLTVPVQPDPDEAQQWVIDELSKPEYQIAKPSWFDQLVGEFLRWLGSIFQATGTPADAIAPIVAVVITAGVIVAAFLLFGRPRLRHATTRRQTGAVFGSDDTRSAKELRESARLAHASGDEATAIEELFRALARRLDERAQIDVSPGMTAQDFASRATRPFPADGAALRTAAGHFDAVRYLERPGTGAMYDDVDAVTTRLWDARADQDAPADRTEALA